MYLKKYKSSKKTNSPQNLPLTAWGDFSNNCWSKSPGVGRISAPTTEKFQKRKNLAKKVMAKDTPLVIYIATSTTPDKTLGWKSGKKLLNCHFFSCPKNAFLGLFFGTRLDDMLDFAPKTPNFLLQARKKISKTQNFLKINLLLQSVFLVVLKAGLKILTKFLAKKSKFSVKNFFELLFWTYRLLFGSLLLNFRWRRCFHKISKKF